MVKSVKYVMGNKMNNSFYYVIDVTIHIIHIVLILHYNNYLIHNGYVKYVKINLNKNKN